MIHKNEWWFSIIDVIEVLTGSDRPREYWSDLKNSLALEGYSEVSKKIGQLKMIAPDGKMRVSSACIELARHGFVVLNIDAIGRGNSGIPGRDPKAPGFDRTFGLISEEHAHDHRPLG